MRANKCSSQKNPNTTDEQPSTGSRAWKKVCLAYLFDNWPCWIMRLSMTPNLCGFDGFFWGSVWVASHRKAHSVLLALPHQGSWRQTKGLTLSTNDNRRLKWPSYTNILPPLMLLLPHQHNNGFLPFHLFCQHRACSAAHSLATQRVGHKEMVWVSQ